MRKVKIPKALEMSTARAEVFQSLQALKYALMHTGLTFPEPNTGEYFEKV